MELFLKGRTSGLSPRRRRELHTGIFKFTVHNKSGEGYFKTWSSFKRNNSSLLRRDDSSVVGL